jgi:hypothetical protein
MAGSITKFTPPDSYIAFTFTSIQTVLPLEDTNDDVFASDPSIMSFTTIYIHIRFLSYIHPAHSLNRSFLMKRLSLLIVFLFTFSETFSQFKDSDLSLTLGYPVPVGYNFVNKGAGNGYTGIADIGLDYTLFKANRLDAGFLMNASFLTFRLTHVSLTSLSPKVKIGYTIKLKKIDIQPQLAAGYTHFSFDGPEYTHKEGIGGPAFKASTKIILKSEKKINYFASLAYEFSKMGLSTPAIPDIKFNRNIQLITPGIGVLWKFSRI